MAPAILGIWGLGANSRGRWGLQTHRPIDGKCNNAVGVVLFRCVMVEVAATVEMVVVVPVPVTRLSGRASAAISFAVASRRRRRL